MNACALRRPAELTASVRAKLEADGHFQYDIEVVLKSTLVRNERPLNDRAWAKLIPKLKAKIDEVRQARRQLEYVDRIERCGYAWDHRQRNKPLHVASDAMVPVFMDIAALPAIHDLVLDELDQEPKSASWPMEQNAQAIIQDDTIMRDFVEAFSAERTAELQAIVGDAGDLGHAATVFKCQCGRRAVHGRKLTDHRCLSDARPSLAAGVDRSIRSPMITCDVEASVLIRKILARTGVAETHQSLARVRAQGRAWLFEDEAHNGPVHYVYDVQEYEPIEFGTMVRDAACCRC